MLFVIGDGLVISVGKHSSSSIQILQVSDLHFSASNQIVEWSLELGVLGKSDQYCGHSFSAKSYTGILPAVLDRTP